MNKKGLIIAIGVSFVFTIIVGFLLLEAISAQECRVIRVLGTTKFQTLKIEPETSTISKGDCVVWYNRAPVNGVMIVFEEGKKCTDEIGRASCRERV